MKQIHVIFLLLIFAFEYSGKAETTEQPSKQKIYTQALVAALDAHDVEVASILIKNKDDLKATMPDGMPVFVKAAFSASSGEGVLLITKMLALGADINAQAPDGINALMVLDRIGISDLRGYLLTKGAKDYDRNTIVNKARATKIDAMLLNFVTPMYAAVTSADPTKLIPFEKLVRDDGFFEGKHGIFPPWPIWGVVTNSGKDVFGNFFTIDPKKFPTYVFVSEDTVKLTSEVVDRSFWEPYVR